MSPFKLLTLGSLLITLTGIGKLLLVIGFWFPGRSAVLCSHWEKSLTPLGPCGPCDPLKPWGPCVPLNPWGPAGPIGPWEPLKPRGPTGPWSLLTLSNCGKKYFIIQQENFYLVYLIDKAKVTMNTTGWGRKNYSPELNIDSSAAS